MTHPSSIQASEWVSLKRVFDTETSLPLSLTQILKEDCERNELRLREIRGEIELMQSLNHPNIVQYIASGQEPRTFVVMERLEGGSLNQRLGFAPTHSGKCVEHLEQWWGGGAEVAATDYIVLVLLLGIMALRIHRCT